MPEGRHASTAGRYRPIRDYGIIGDCHGNALVDRHGSVDWCCLGRHDAEPTFCRLLDADRGGFWAIRPSGDATVERGYRSSTNILETRFATPTGSVTLTDFMPVGRHVDAGAHDYVRLIAPFWLIRRIRATAGSVEVEVTYRPSAGFTTLGVRLDVDGEAVRADGCPTLFARLPFTIADGTATARVTLAAGESCDLVLAARTVAGQSPLDRVAEMLAITDAFWREWIAYNRYAGPHREAVGRSALVLKLLTYAPTGALVAAPTTSLPEALGGSRNWDYRFSWLRDSCFTLYALAGLGYGGEARRYVHYLATCIRRTLPRALIMYGIEYETRLEEEDHLGLDGYAESRPVRTGNGAYSQRQIDIYGQVLDLALLFERLGGRLDRQQRRLLEAFAALVEDEWRLPDQGLWEMRGEALDHVHGKLMCWAAADRAARLGLGDEGHWRELAAAVARSIDSRGIGADGQLLQAFDRPGTDAATLLAPMLGFPLQSGTLEATIAAVTRELRHGPYLHRYKADDGLDGEEGAFLICSFWLVDALLAAGRGQEAAGLFAALVPCANDLGLYAEEIDPENGAFLGNFPQAFTHLALIGSAVNLELFEQHGVAGIAGAYADRAGRAVGAVYGWRGIWSAIRNCRRVGRLTRSKKSILLWP